MSFLIRWQVSLALTIGLLILSGPVKLYGQIKNFDSEGRQITRFSSAGDAIDAHDGEIAQFDKEYYLYGTSYDCGFEWGNKKAPFCGFKVYSSTDLTNWTDRGFLFDAQTAVWQTRCNGNTYGCFRPHVIYNRKFNNYVLWINVYDNVVGYRVFTSKTPVGPFTEVKEPTLAVNSNMPAAGLNNGDHDTFVDDDGMAYIAYTDWRAGGSIVIERLSPDYLTGTGDYIKAVTKTSTEAPGLFKRKGRYYITYSDPNCGYCAGTGTAYRMARGPLGPWSEGRPISSNSCGGQPSFVSTIKINSETVYFYGSDLWNNAAKNEALANYYWAPLQFNKDGSIRPLNCRDSYHNKNVSPKGKDAEKAIRFTSKVAVDSSTRWAQNLIIEKSGTITSINLEVFKANSPNKDLIVTIYSADSNAVDSEKKILYLQILPARSIGWSAKRMVINPMLKVNKAEMYTIVLSTEASKGYYGFEATETSSKTLIVLLTSKDGGKSYLPGGDGIINVGVVIK